MSYRIIHCADLHLDSAMDSSLTREKARERKTELLNTFERMVKYAASEGIADIIIAGDLFDTGRVSQTAVKFVAGIISENPQISFYYLRGNHDADSFIEASDILPDNLKLFGRKRPVSYEICGGSIVITGLEPGEEFAVQMQHGLVLDRDRFNIVVLHGQDSRYELTDRRDRAELISLNSLKGKGIDYLALGHIHARREGRLDERGRYCYPGCLEGRGFDECGSHGFTELDIDVQTGFFEIREVPFASRRLEEVRVDISEAMTTREVMTLCEQAFERQNISPKDMVKLIFTGAVDIDSERDDGLIAKSFENRFYYIKLKDETHFRVDYESFRLDKSLKGEFVRCVYGKDDIPEEDKATIIRYGIRLLSGEREVE